MYKTIIIGLILLIINIILDMGISTLPIVKSTPFLHWCVIIISKICASIGLALVVGYFTNRIKTSEIIESYINMTKQQKNKILELLVDSKNDNALGTYKKNLIEDVLEYNSKYRDNVTYNARVFEMNNIVYAETTMNYIEYRSLNDNELFSELRTTFDSSNSKVEYYKITHPDNVNDYVIIKEDQIKLRNTKAHGDSLIYEQYCEIPERFRKLPYLCIEKKYIFTGEDHWINYTIMFARPLIKMSFTLTIEKDLSFKEVTVIGNENLYSKSQDDHSITFTSTKWLSHYNGFSIIIAKP